MRDRPSSATVRAQPRSHSQPLTLRSVLAAAALPLLAVVAAAVPLATAAFATGALAAVAARAARHAVSPPSGTGSYGPVEPDSTGSP